MSEIWKTYGPTVQVSGQMIRDSQSSFDKAVKSMFETAVRESMLDITDGPRFGPRRVLNDAQQEAADHRAALIRVLEDVADEWGIDLHEDCER